MLPLEITAAVQYNVFGEATPPAAVAAKIQQCVNEAAEQVQNRANWWFLITSASFASVAGTFQYALPSNYKETISVLYKGSDGNYRRLTRLTIKEIQEKRNITTQGEPLYYAIVGSNLEIYPYPNYSPANPATNVIHQYYLRISALTGANFTTNAANVLFTDADYPIVALATSKVAAAYDYASKKAQYDIVYQDTLDELYARHNARELGDNRSPRYVDV